MTWNVENLFPPGARVSPQSTRPVTKEAFASKVGFVASVLTDRRPDIVALQEIGGADSGDETVLNALQDRLGSQYPHRAVSTFPDARQIRVAFLSRLPLSNVEHFRAFPQGPLESVRTFSDTPQTAMGRGALSVVLQPENGWSVRLVTAHLKSKLLTFPRAGGRVSFSTENEDERAFAAGIALARRAAEAATIRAFVNTAQQAAPDVETIVLGDMNDEPQAATSELLQGGEVDRDIRSTDRFDWVRLHNLTYPLPLRGPKFQTLVPEGQDFTRVHEGRPQLIDHIYASKRLVFRDDAFRVTIRILVDLIEGQNLTASPEARVGVEAPDHAPVIAAFDLE